MFEAFFVVAAMTGAISLAYFLLAILADIALPYFASKPWRVNRRRSQACYIK